MTSINKLSHLYREHKNTGLSRYKRYEDFALAYTDLFCDWAEEHYLELMEEQ